MDEVVLPGVAAVDFSEELKAPGVDFPPNTGILDLDEAAAAALPNSEVVGEEVESVAGVLLEGEPPNTLAVGSELGLPSPNTVIDGL